MTDAQTAGPPASGRRFLAGVVEGFYGAPWTQNERFALFDWMAAFGLDTYVYAPKDDLKHRVLWREPYSADDAGALGELVRACSERGLRFVYALAPGLDIRFGLDSDRARLRARFEQMMALGCGDFALLFDDIPGGLHPDDLARWSSPADAQSDLANDTFGWLRTRRPGARLLFCPTPYCGRMARAQLGGPGYLETLGRQLDPGIDVFWTGPEIVSREIPVAHVRELQALLRRMPLLWDNLHANDYDGRRFFCGPYAGRPPELRDHVAGILANPNNELPLNYVPLLTLGSFLRCGSAWDARQAYLAGLDAWRGRFDTVGPPIPFDDLVLLGDCFYLPFEDGPRAAALFEAARRLLTADPAGWGDAACAFRQQAGRLRDVCARVAELRDRRLFHALSRRAWELREEMDLLLTYVRCKEEDAAAPCQSGFHLPGTYRGGMVARLQHLLRQRPDGTFIPAAGPGTEDDRPGTAAEVAP